MNGQLNDDIPSHIKALYQRPQDEWGTDEWRTMSLYLLGELQAANRRVREADESLAKARRGAAILGTLFEKVVFRDAASPKKSRGRPKGLKKTVKGLAAIRMPAPRMRGRPAAMTPEEKKAFIDRFSYTKSLLRSDSTDEGTASTIVRMLRPENSSAHRQKMDVEILVSLVRRLRHDLKIRNIGKNQT